jgi:DNA-binding NarL/FixJ family response regulator
MPTEAVGKIRCVVADDHPAILDAVGRFLREAEEIDLVGLASDGDQAARIIATTGPAVAILDVRMPGHSGVDLARSLHSARSATAVILYTGEADRALLLEALDAGARGFMLKEAPLGDVLRAIGIVARGGTYVDAGLAGLLTGGDASGRLSILTQREREILRLLADGMRNEEVGAHLHLSPHTVRTHVKNAMEKLDADTRTQAVATALRQSLIT